MGKLSAGRATRKNDFSISRKVGTFLRDQRQAAGISEAATASYLEISEQTLRRYESGESAIPMFVIYAISNFLNLSPMEVLRVIRQAQ